MDALKLSAMVLGVTMLFSGCSSPPKAPTTSAAGTAATPAISSSAKATPQPATQSTVKSVSLPEYLDPNNPISKERSVYFDFDAYAVKSEFNTLLEKQGRYLTTNPGIAIKVEGNTDERGIAEYNLALGHKRAESVVHALKLLGVKDAQMEAVSWGMEKPKAAGHDETAWAENRRVDLTYPKQ